MPGRVRAAGAGAGGRGGLLKRRGKKTLFRFVKSLFFFFAFYHNRRFSPSFLSLPLSFFPRTNKNAMATTLVADFATPAEGPVSQLPVVSAHEARENAANDEAAAAAAVAAPAAATTAAAEPVVRFCFFFLFPLFPARFFPIVSR